MIYPSIIDPLILFKEQIEEIKEEYSFCEEMVEESNSMSDWYLSKLATLDWLFGVEFFNNEKENKSTESVE